MSMLASRLGLSTGNEDYALLALVEGKWGVLRVPYPLSFYAKGMDGRIDDPNAGWKRARGVDEERRPGAVAEGRRQGYGPDRLPFPAAPHPPCRSTARAAEPTRNNQNLTRSGPSFAATKDGDRPLTGAQVAPR